MEGEFDREKEWFDLDIVDRSPDGEPLGNQLERAVTLHVHNHPEKEKKGVREDVEAWWKKPDRGRSGPEEGRKGMSNGFVEENGGMLH